MQLYYDVLEFDHHQFYLIASETGLCFVGSPDAPLSEVNHFFTTDELTQNEAKIAPIKQQLTEFMTGTRTDFSINLDPLFGTPLQQQVWHALAAIPYGETTTYSQLAATTDHPTAIRAVASTVGRNPWLIVVPCHRVLRADHNLGGYRGGLLLKEALLAMEQNRTALAF